MESVIFVSFGVFNYECFDWAISIIDKDPSDGRIINWRYVHGQSDPWIGGTINWDEWLLRIYLMISGWIGRGAILYACNYVTYQWITENITFSVRLLNFNECRGYAHASDICLLCTNPYECSMYAVGAMTRAYIDRHCRHSNVESIQRVYPVAIERKYIIMVIPFDFRQIIDRKYLEYLFLDNRGAFHWGKVNLMADQGLETLYEYMRRLKDHYPKWFGIWKRDDEYTLLRTTFLCILNGVHKVLHRLPVNRRLPADLDMLSCCIDPTEDGRHSSVNNTYCPWQYVKEAFPQPSSHRFESHPCGYLLPKDLPPHSPDSSHEDIIHTICTRSNAP